MIYADNAATTKMSRTAMDAMIPCMQEDKYTRILEGNEAGRVLSLLRRLSPNVSIGSDGEISPAA